MQKCSCTHNHKVTTKACYFRYWQWAIIAVEGWWNAEQHLIQIWPPAEACSCWYSVRGRLQTSTTETAKTSCVTAAHHYDHTQAPACVLGHAEPVPKELEILPRCSAQMCGQAVSA